MRQSKPLAKYDIQGITQREVSSIKMRTPLHKTLSMGTNRSYTMMLLPGTFAQPDMLTRIIISLLLAHVITVFYASSFQWTDLAQLLERQSLRKTYCGANKYVSVVVVVKATTCFICIFCSLCGQISARSGSVLTVLLAVPQLYRGRGVLSQRVRVVLGPVAPILAVNNVWWRPNDPLTLASAIIAFLAFVVFRPDNTAMMQPCCRLLGRWPMLPDDWANDDCGLLDGKKRRRIHGILAAGHTLLAVLSLVSSLSTYDESRQFTL
jgi:hypothetical protein